MMTYRFQNVNRWLALLPAVLALVLLTTGCRDQADSEANGEGADHAGHAHGEGKAPIAAAHSHETPGETCFICDPAKRDKGRLWCKEHGRYEDRCWLCHPELEEKSRLYCKEHFLYEDECFLCNPELAPQGKNAPQQPAGDSHGQHEGGGLFCGEHGVLEAQCAICQPDLAASLEPGGSMMVRLPSTASAQKVGIRTGSPRMTQSAPVVDAYCEVQYNLNTMAKITPLAGGVIRSVAHDVGQRVATGDVLVELHSPEVATAKSEYLSALVELDIRRQAFERQSRLREQQIAAEKDVLEAQAAYRTVELTRNNLRQKLVNLGVRDGEIDTIERTQDTSAHLVVRAPFGGTLVERRAVIGEAVAVGDTMFVLADLASRWLVLSVPAAHLAHVQIGQAVEARFEELPGETIQGAITWIDTSVDPRSRMVRARALVTEDAGQVKTGLFGKARILTGGARQAAVVPRDAVQRHEGGRFVFVAQEPDLFALRSVTLGASHGESLEVLAGLDAGESVVTDGSFIIMSEFLKSRLGAGCADH